MADNLGICDFVVEQIYFNLLDERSFDVCHFWNLCLHESFVPLFFHFSLVWRRQRQLWISLILRLRIAAAIDLIKIRIRRFRMLNFLNYQPCRLFLLFNLLGIFQNGTLFFFIFVIRERRRIHLLR